MQILDIVNASIVFPISCQPWSLIEWVSSLPAQDGNDHARNNQIENEEERFPPQMQVNDCVGEFALFVSFDDARGQSDIPRPRPSIISHDGIWGGWCGTPTIVPQMPHLIGVVRPRAKVHCTSEGKKWGKRLGWFVYRSEWYWLQFVENLTAVWQKFVLFLFLFG